LSLVDLVCFVYLVDLVHLVSFVQPKNQTDQTNLIDLRDSYVIPARKEQTKNHQHHPGFGILLRHTKQRS